MSLKDRLKELREAKGWTQGQLSTYSGVERPLISKIETGLTKNPGADKLMKLAKALDVSVDSLIDAKREPAEAELDDLVIYLSASKVDAKTLRQIRRIAEGLIAENERDKEN